MGKPTYWVLAAICMIAVLIGFILGQRAGAPLSRSAVYEIPMAKGQPWRVTSFEGKIYILIEAPSMPEDIRKGVSQP